MLRLLPGIVPLLISTLPVHSPAFSQNIWRVFLVLSVVNTTSCVGPQNKIGHQAHRYRQLMHVPVLIFWLVGALSKDYIWAESQLQSVSKLFISQLIIPYVSFFSNHNSDSTHTFGTQTQINNNTCFGVYLYSTVTQHRNLPPAE